MLRSKPHNVPIAEVKPTLARGPTRWKRCEWLPTALLVCATLITFSPLRNCDFVDFDDPYYVTQNANVQTGLTARSFHWAWTTTHTANWHPLTWLSLMLDAQSFGSRPWGYHLTNLLLHLANTLLLFTLLRKLTGAVWRSALVAALFTVHPLHVESVAWVSERKDVLSTLFGLLALWAYARYVEAPGVGRYLLIVLGMALSLLAKPMLVTLPFLLLLLDYWPLCRWQPGVRESVSGRWLLLEKVPLLALSVASCVVTMWAQQRGGAVKSLEQLSLPERLGNALVSYVQYLRQMLLPLDLAAFYPHPGTGLNGAVVVGAGVLLAAVTVLALWWGRRYPYLAVGWLWYMGMLVPTIGLVQVGLQARADRYTYLPLVGIFLLTVWGLAELARRWRIERPIAILAVAVLACLMVVSSLQVEYWRDTRALWERALQETESNPIVHSNLGNLFLRQKELDKAIPHYREAVRLSPKDVRARYNLGNALLQQGEISQAVQHLEECLRLDPLRAPAHDLLGNALLRQGKRMEAIQHGREAVRLDPDSAQAHFNLGNALLSQEQVEEAIQHFRETVRLDPNSAPAHYNLGNALLRRGDLVEAIVQLRETARLDPGSARAYNNLGVALMSHGELAESVQQFQQAVHLNSYDAAAHANMGLAYQLRGDWEQAVACFRQALALRSQIAEYHCGLAFALHQQGRTEDAQKEYRLSLQLDPDWPKTSLRKAWTMATHPTSFYRNGTRARQTAEQVLQATGVRDAETLDVLAAACAESGRFTEAGEAARQARAQASAAGQKSLAGQIEERLGLYEKGRPFRTADGLGRLSPARRP